MWQSLTAQKYLTTSERAIEQFVFASRWLLAPFYAGLAVSIIVLLIKFLAELFHLAAHAFTSTESQVILGVLSLVDMALTASLLIIVIFSGYQNFVSRIDHESHKDWPQWMGTIDFSALKLKLLSSIVAISAIQLLKQFMAIKDVTDRDLMFLITIHVVFVVSSVLLALADRIAGHDGAAHQAAPMSNEPLYRDDSYEGSRPASPRTKPAEIEVASAAGSVHEAPRPAAPAKPIAPRKGDKGHK